MRLSFLLGLFLWSCSGDSVPKGIIPPEKMEAVLYDVILADELVDFSSLQDSTYRPFSRRTALYDSIFQIHSIRKEDYEKSMQFYQSRPDILKEILEEMQKRSDTTGKTPPNPKPIKPS